MKFLVKCNNYLNITIISGTFVSNIIPYDTFIN